MITRYNLMCLILINKFLQNNSSSNLIFFNILTTFPLIFILKIYQKLIKLLCVCQETNKIL